MANLLDKASIILTPTAYSDGKMHSAKPIVSTNPSIGDFDFARASVATRINEQGLLEEVASGLPRIDYTDGSGSWLLEPASTNLITQSEDFSNAYWTKDGSSVTGGFTSPKGDLSAFKLVEGNANSKHYIPAVNTNTSGYVTQSIYAKYLSRYLRLTIHDAGNVNKWYSVIYDLENGTIYNSLAKTITVFGSKIEKMANGYYRCVITADLGASSTTSFYIQLSNGASILSTDDRGRGSYQGDGTSGLYIFGAQAEENSYATSYIKTVGTAQTRVADTATGSGNSTVINSTEGTLYAEIKGFENDLSGRYISLSDGTANNSIRIYYYSDGGTVFFRKNVNSVDVITSSTNTINQSSLTKIAVRYDSTSFDIFSNGVKLITNSNSDAFTSPLNDISFNNSGSSTFYGKTKSLQVYTTALTDIEIEKITSWTSFTAMANALNYTII